MLQIMHMVGAEGAHQMNYYHCSYLKSFGSVEQARHDHYKLGASSIR
jgi:hypothetical protein